MRTIKNFNSFYWLFKDYFDIDCEKIEKITINDGLVKIITKTNKEFEFELLDLIGNVYDDLSTFKNDLNQNSLES